MRTRCSLLVILAVFFFAARNGGIGSRNEMATAVVERADEGVVVGVGAKDFGNVVVDAAEDAAGVGNAAVNVTEGAAGVRDAAVVVAIVVGAEVVEAVGEGELVASAASGVGDARENGKAEDADDPVVEASSAAGEVGDTSDEVDEGACAAVVDATIVGASAPAPPPSSVTSDPFAWKGHRWRQTQSPWWWKVWKPWRSIRWRG